MAGSSVGAPSTCTLLGPPERISAAGLRAASSAAVIRWGTISEYTCSSRTRRAISWAYWAPKSTTRTACSCSGMRSVGGSAVTSAVKLSIVLGDRW